MMKQNLVQMMVLCGFCCACGIPKDQYQAKVNEVERLTQELGATVAVNQQLQMQLEQLRSEHQRMASRLQELGQNLADVIGEKSLLATDLEATRAREAALRAEQEAQRERMAKYRSVLQKFQSLVDAGKLKIRIVNGQMVVQMDSNILFQTGRADLSDDGQAALTDLAAILATIEDRKFQIAGHTDNIPIRSARFPSNWELSTARAVSVVKFLQDNGVSPVNFSAAGFAEFQPTASNDTSDGRASNRRIEITLLPNLDELPDLSDLERDIR